MRQGEERDFTQVDRGLFEIIEILKNVEKIDNYGDSSFFPVFGGKLKGYSGKPGTEEI